MTKLTDMQLVLLTTACQREDGSLLPPPESLGDEAARIRKAIEALIKKGLATEKEGVTAAQSWRTDGDLVIGVVVTDAGRAIIEPSTPQAPGGGSTDDAGSAPNGGSEQTAGGTTSPTAPRSGSKQSLLVDLLKRATGASLDEIVQATGWLPHTSRAALTGLRKKGHDISKEKVEGTTRYQIKAVA